MFWPFATSMEELMIYSGRADLYDYYRDMLDDQSNQTANHASNGKENR